MFAQGQLTRRNLKPAFASGLFTSARRKSASVPGSDVSLSSILAAYSFDTDVNPWPNLTSLVNSAPSNTNGKSGEGSQYFGSQVVVATTPDNLYRIDLGDRTFAMWVKLDSLGTGEIWAGIHEGSNNANSQWRFGSPFAQYGCSFINSGGATVNMNYGNALDLNWHLMVITVSGLTLKFYLDGLLKGTQTPAGFNVPPSPVFALGSDYTLQSALVGTLDEFMIWDRALTALEVTTLYNIGTGTFTPFVGSLATNFQDGFKFEPGAFLTSVGGTRTLSAQSSYEDGFTRSGSTFVTGKNNHATGHDGSSTYDEDNYGTGHFDPSSGNLSLSFWINVDAAQTNPNFFLGSWDENDQSGSQFKIGCLTADGSLQLGVCDGGVFDFFTIAGTTGFVNSGWRHVAVKITAGTTHGIKFRFYVDGVFVDQVDDYDMNSFQNYDFKVGGDNDGAWGKIKVDELYCWQRALSDAEIIRLASGNAKGFYPFA